MKPLVLVLLAPAAFATVIIDPIPTISTVCTVDSSPVACGTDSSPAIYGIQHVSADTAFSLAGLNTDSGLIIQVMAEATAGAENSITRNTVSSSAVASIALDFLGSTDGPERQGFATYWLTADGDHGGSAGATAFASIGGLGSCQYPQCNTRGTLVPFELGVPFEIQLFAFGSGGSGPHSFDGGGAFAEIQLQLFNSDGSAVTIFDPVAVPEPTSASMLAAGILLLFTFRCTKAALRY